MWSPRIAFSGPAAAQSGKRSRGRALELQGNVECSFVLSDYIFVLNAKAHIHKVVVLTGVLYNEQWSELSKLLPQFSIG